MGDIADSIIDGTFDMYTGEYLGEAVGYPRTATNNKSYKSYKLTEAEKNIKYVRKELAKLVEIKEKAGEKDALQMARREINLKYGRGWRERIFLSDWKPLSEY